jgi:hypothetical protein
MAARIRRHVALESREVRRFRGCEVASGEARAGDPALRIEASALLLDRWQSTSAGPCRVTGGLSLMRGSDTQQSAMFS